jgi:hypothetical protein
MFGFLLHLLGFFFLPTLRAPRAFKVKNKSKPVFLHSPITKMNFFGSLSPDYLGINNRFSILDSLIAKKRLDRLFCEKWNRFEMTAGAKPARQCHKLDHTSKSRGCCSLVILH